MKAVALNLMKFDHHDRTRRPGAQVQLDLFLLPHGSREIAVLLAIPTFGPSVDCSTYYALC